MASRTRFIQSKILISQAVIFIAGLLLVLFLFGANFLKSERNLQHVSIDNLIKQYTSYLQEFQYLPNNISGTAHIPFVIDQKEGNYVIERKDTDSYDKLLWEQYRSKLIYQMQKQRQGWINYPLKKPWQFFVENKIIRYITLDNPGWIIVVEAVYPSEFALAKKVFSAKMLFQIFLLALAGLFVIHFNIKHALHDLKRSLADSLEKNFFNIDKEDLAKKSKTTNLVAPETMKAHIPPVVKTESTVTESPKVSQESSSLINSDMPFISKAADIALQKKGQVQYFEKPKAQEEKVESVRPIRSTPAEAEDEGAWDDLTIELKGIQSPALKKMIKELRNE